MAFNKKTKGVPSIDQRGPYAVYAALEKKAKAADSTTEAGKKIIEEYNGTKWFCTDAQGTAHYGEIWFRGSRYSSEHVLASDLKANIAIGNVTVGQKFDANTTTLESILRQILTKPLMEQTFEIQEVSGLRYTGSAQQLATIKTSLVGSSSAYFSTTKELNADNYSDGETNIENIKGNAVGTYTVYFYVPEDDQYESASGSINVSIGRRLNTKPESKNVTFSGSAYSLATPNANWSWGGTYTATHVIESISEVTASITNKETDCWADETDSDIKCSLTINRAAFPGKVQITGWTYGSFDSTKNVPTMSSNPENATPTYTVKKGSGEYSNWDNTEMAAAYPDSYTVRAVISEGADYLAYDGTASLTISKIAQTITLSKTTITEASQLGDQVITVTDNNNTSSLGITAKSSNSTVVALNGGSEVTVSDNKFTITKLAAGTSTITVTKAGDDTHAAATATLTVTLSNYYYVGQSTSTISIVTIDEILGATEFGAIPSSKTVSKQWENDVYNSEWIAVLTSVYSSGTSVNDAFNSPDTDSTTTIEVGKYTVFLLAANGRLATHTLTVTTL